jgi:hypothetical protein
MVRLYDPQLSTSPPHPTARFLVFGREWTPKLRLITKERVAYLSRPDSTTHLKDDGTVDFVATAADQTRWLIDSIQHLLTPGPVSLAEAVAELTLAGTLLTPAEQDAALLELDAQVLADWWTELASIVLHGNDQTGDDATDPTDAPSPDA